ncbi:PQQ-dependent sugar dehydrogenase [Natronospira bacteriovora]|uniref:PQQ-dependent sugar dehydrogenase n=1 Tax=Natronospira bacteriovora TaxID=3069753 RepID=A0ABU0W484_9GAMM|nr:PQQ-dependent sugar dehydrogenase [Natronospira sp. AB-CW4]MDQ2068832.1 PQQ-dependent sugar dehydrogenase [Natronospira sp. AB-CW4]
MITQRLLVTVSALLGLLLLVPAQASEVNYRIETVADGLNHPWSLAFLPDGRMLVTERAGRLRLIDADGQLQPEPVEGVPEAYVASQGGLFEVLPHPAYEDNGWLYLSLAHGTARANTTRVVRGRLQEHALVDVEVLFDAEPTRSTPVHYGGRMAFLPDGSLLLGLGDGFDYREEAQKPDNHLGTLIRLNDEGSVPPDNPFVDDEERRPEIYSYGHRNIQGIVHDPGSGLLWSHEHGPRGGDELNIIRPGANYGWPAATHGIDYSGARISPHRTLPGMEEAVLVWTPAIAPAGLSQYRGEQFPEWEGDLLIAGLVARAILRVSLDGESAREEERLFREVGERMRDVRVGPDGAIYLLTDSRDGKLLRVERDAS